MLNTARCDIIACPHEHEISHDDSIMFSSIALWCIEGEERTRLGAIRIARTSTDASDEIRLFIQATMRDHEAEGFGKQILDLTTQLEACKSALAAAMTIAQGPG